MDYIVHGILQARILEWVAFPFSRGIFPTQGWNPGLPHCRWILYQLSHQGSPPDQTAKRGMQTDGAEVYGSSSELIPGLRGLPSLEPQVSLPILRQVWEKPGSPVLCCVWALLMGSPSGTLNRAAPPAQARQQVYNGHAQEYKDTHMLHQPPGLPGSGSGLTTGQGSRPPCGTAWGGVLCN